LVVFGILLNRGKRGFFLYGEGKSEIKISSEKKFYWGFEFFYVPEGILSEQMIPTGHLK